MKLYLRRCTVDLKGEPLIHHSVRFRHHGHGVTLRLPRNHVATLLWGKPAWL